MKLPFKNRISAGKELAKLLSNYCGKNDVIVLALPRGGVPVANEIAEALSAKLDLMIVRKLGVPWHRELAMGSIASGGIRVINSDVVMYEDISEADIERIAQIEMQELKRRESAYRGSRPSPSIKNQCVILVDDGVATGATMRAAILAVGQQRPKEIIVAIPVAPIDTVRELKQMANEVICLATPEPFYGVGQWYDDFRQTDDEEVVTLLQRAWQRESEKEVDPNNVLKVTGIETIEPKTWSSFCEVFGREHEGWLVTLTEVETENLRKNSDRPMQYLRKDADQLPLITLSFSSIENVLKITLLENARKKIFSVESPLRIDLEKSGEIPVGIRIDKKAGRTLLLEFRTAAMPETLDGLAEFEYT